MVAARFSIKIVFLETLLAVSWKRFLKTESPVFRCVPSRCLLERISKVRELSLLCIEFLGSIGKFRQRYRYFSYRISKVRDLSLSSEVYALDRQENSGRNHIFLKPEKKKRSCGLFECDKCSLLYDSLNWSLRELILVVSVIQIWSASMGLAGEASERIGNHIEIQRSGKEKGCWNFHLAPLQLEI